MFSNCKSLISVNTVLINTFESPLLIVTFLIVLLELIGSPTIELTTISVIGLDTFDNTRMMLFNENRVYANLLKEKKFDFFANSFFIEVAK